MTSLDMINSESFPEDLDFVRNKTFKNSSVINNYESDDEQNPDDNDEEQIRNSFFKNGFQDETYQDELFGENTSHVIINNSNDLMFKGDDSIESNDDDGHNDFRMSRGQLFEGPKEFDATIENVTNSLKHNEEILGTEEEIDSIFESVSVAYENRLKNLKNEEVEFEENELKNYPEFDAIDEKLMRELLELSIDDQHQPINPANQNFAASSIDQTFPNDKLPTSQLPKSNFVKQSARLTSPSSARLKESQKKLSDIMRKLNSGKSTNKQINISSNNQTSSKSKPLLFRPEKPQSATTARKSNTKTQISPRPSSCIVKSRNNSAKNKQTSPNICTTPRPAFRAGSLTDFSRKIDDDGRRTVAGKNNPYWKLKPTFSHKASYVDEMLFGQNSSTPRNFESTWQAPWQAKSKPSRPHFCDWVYDRRKPQNT